MGQLADWYHLEVLKASLTTHLVSFPIAKNACWTFQRCSFFVLQRFYVFALRHIVKLPNFQRLRL